MPVHNPPIEPPAIVTFIRDSSLRTGSQLSSCAPHQLGTLSARKGALSVDYE
jgi:hypothetical protein